MSTPEPYPYRKLNYPVNNLAQDFNATQKDQVRQNIGIPSSVNKAGKVLKVDDNTGNLSWEDESGAYTAGNMIDITGNAISVDTTIGITDIQLVNALPANPTATVLYLIPET